MKCKTLLFSIFVCFNMLLFGQNTSLSGRVTDEKGDAMTGVTVSVKGTTIATASDADGKWTLDVPAGTRSLSFKYVGYEEREIAVAEIARKAGFSLKLNSADVGLNQVVVSASKKREKLLDAPASISVLSGERITNKVVTSSVDYLKGTPGVDVMQTGLVSNNVVVRGFNNIFSGTVLNVVDNRIGSVPSLRVNTYQLVPTSNLDIDRIEVLRGPASALYGPNASSGVVHIMTKNPLDQEKKFETTIAFNSGFIAQGSNTNGLDAHTQSVGADRINYSIINPEFRHSGKLANGKFGYKISGSYFQGKDYLNYDPREPNPGDSMIFGSVKNGQTFQPDSLNKRNFKSPYTGDDTTTFNYDIRRFARDFEIRKWSADGRMDYRPINDLTITLNGGVAQSSNIELTGLGAGQVKGWIYWYVQARLKWKNLFFQYFVNSSDAGNTYLIPQLTPFSRQPSTYNSPYQVQRLIDKSKLHAFQLQHSWAPHRKVNLVYGLDALLTLPETEGTINGRFDGHDNIYQAGAYIQADYDPLKWLKLVGAARIDYNSIINNVAFSPRVAVVFKPKQGQNIRVTFNRAFDAPTSLEQFLDLANGQIPNGINVRGIGNPYGYKYSYDAQGNVQFITAPYGGGPGSWVTFGDQSNNYKYLDSATKLIGYGLAKQVGYDPSLVAMLLHNVFDGIAGPSGLIQSTKQDIIDYAALAQTRQLVNFKPTDFKNLARINNETTQTLEVGWKGLFMSKLQIQVDAYWTRKENYVGALTSASGAVILDIAHNQAVIDRLKQNLGPLESTLKPLLNNQPAYTNNNIIKSDTSSVYDEIVVLLTQLPVGTVTPKDSKVNSDYILTYQNLGTLDLFGADLGVQYQATKDVYISGSFSIVDKDHITISTGQIAWLNAPKYKASISLDHVISKVGFGYGATWRWQDAYMANSSVYVGEVSAANLFDARISYRPKFYKGLLLAVNVNNLLNYKWQSFPGTAHMGTTLMWKAQVTF